MNFFHKQQSMYLCLFLQDSEKIAAILLNRTVDTNKFLQLDSHHALDAMVENITPSKAIPAIIQEGLK